MEDNPPSTSTSSSSSGGGGSFIRRFMRRCEAYKVCLPCDLSLNVSALCHHASTCTGSL